MTKEKQIRIYILLTALFILMGFIMLFIPDKKVDRQLSPRSVVKIYNHGSAYYSPDRVAQLIMEENPVLQLVDVRSSKEFEQFSLEGAINIPLDKLFKRDKRNRFVNSDYLKPDKNITIFYSNGDVKATEAWVLAKRLHLNKVYILKGGLNNWVQSIMRPQAPDINTATPKDYAQYSFRKAASSFFGGGSTVASSEADKKVTKKAPVRKKKAVEEEGGC